jgi:hypothetical protein
MSRMDKRTRRSYTEGQSRSTFKGSRNNIEGAFLVHINDIWENTDLTIRLFADVCTIYRKIVHNTNIERMHIDLDTLGELEVENVMKINQGKSKAIRPPRMSPYLVAVGGLRSRGGGAP